MSNALALAAVTTALKALFDAGMSERPLTDALGTGVTVSALPPDQVPIDGPRAGPRLNLFLHRVSQDAALRNSALPVRGADSARAKAPPLALHLHYLLTACATEELQAEVLLGHALLRLHETPMLTPAAIRTVLQPRLPSGTVLSKVSHALCIPDLAESLGVLQIAPEAIDSAAMSALWSALQTRYRPTIAFQVSLVLR